MIVAITCVTCAEEIGTIEKTDVTPDDERMYALSVRCSSGHGGHVDSPEILLEEEVES